MESIRPIRSADDQQMMLIIQNVMTEFGAVGEGFSIVDDEVKQMSQYYSGEKSIFLVIEQEGKIYGGAGIAPLEGADSCVCELKKMYFVPEIRGKGFASTMLENLLSKARAFGYKSCYLETLNSMARAKKLYEKFGFRRLDGPMGATGHFACNQWYLLEL